MSVLPWSDKIAIQSILTVDPFIKDELQFSPNEIYTVKATDELLGITERNFSPKKQIFIYNASSEPTYNPLVFGVVYEVDISTSRQKQGDADLAMEQIMALLDGREISRTHKLEILDMPVVLTSETSLYQVGVRFVTYVSKLNKPRRIRLFR